MATHKRDYRPEDIAFPNQAITESELVGEMQTSYIDYAMSVIVGRALPDVRDGLKPVHRRILYTMYEGNLTSDKPFKKSATCVGDVLGHYHPHGDASVYDAMVRLAQDFSMRYMLVDGHGNFGSVDGDPPAAYRYTEARLSKISNEMLRDIDKETVDWDPNFDESRKEPRVLPSRFPNLLVNGSSGIAVGMATNIPPHNLREVIDACVCVLDDPECELADLMKYIKGPDFPTKGIIMGRSGIRQAYLTGRGRVVIRARTEFEEYGRDGRTRIIVTELPYQVNKRQLIKAIADQPQRHARRHRAQARREPPGGAQPPLRADRHAVELFDQHARAGEQPDPAQDPLAAAHPGRVSGLPGGDRRAPHALRPAEGRGARPSARGPADRAGQHRRGHPHHPLELRQRQAEPDGALLPLRGAGAGHLRHAPDPAAGPQPREARAGV